jgi:hypothetical protein
MTVRPRPTEALLPAAAIAVTSGLPLAYRGRLPDPIATHWGSSGLPDGSLPLIVDHVLMAVLVAIMTIGLLWAAGRADHVMARLLVATSSGLAALFLLLRWWTLEANVGATEWTEAAAMTVSGGVLVLVASLLGGAFGWWAARGRPDRVTPSERIEATRLEAGEQLVWLGRQDAILGRAAVGVALLVAVAVVLASPVPVPAVAALVVGFVAVIVMTFTSIRVAIGPAGLLIRFGPLGFPRLRVAAADIVEVRVEHVEPLAFGGWGYRVVPGTRAVVIRRGEAMRVVRRSAPDLVVTIDGARIAAGVLAAQIGT